MTVTVAHDEVRRGIAEEMRDEPRRDPTDVCVATLDTGLRVLHANDDFLGRLGREASEVHGMHFGELLDASVRPVVLHQLERLAIEKARRFATHFRADHSVAHRFTGGLTALAVRGDDGAVNTIVVLVRPDSGGEHLWPAPARRRLSELDALVLEGVAAGSSTVQLAAKLYLSRQGVEYHVGSMLRRFRCSNRPALVAKAYTQGILTMGQWPPKVTAEHIR